MVDLEYLRMSPFEKFAFKFKAFFRRLPTAFAAFFKEMPKKLYKLWLAFAGIFVNIGRAANDGDMWTRSSFAVMGLGLVRRKQYLRGILYFLFEVAFVLYMVFFGGGYLSKMGSLGKVARVQGKDPLTGVITYTYYDDSFLILLYSILTIFVIFAFAYMWYYSLKGSLLMQQLDEAKQHLPTVREDVKSYGDANYHKSLLAVPMLGLFFFTVLPLFFMIVVAFTNYGPGHIPKTELFQWAGFDSFKTVFGGGVDVSAKMFGQVLLWTIVWAFFATFTNYVLGMLVAILINRKGIKFKKLWRTVLVMTIAIPQFVSLLFMSQLLADQGLLNNLLISWHWIKEPIPFLTDGTFARATVIIVNIWIGIPFSMLICTGILMNIPEDLYESARIDGASPFKAYMKITLPYMLQVTTPYLITQFIGNLNNFNVIYLLSGGGPDRIEGTAGKTDLLITWLYKLTKDKDLYAVASVIGILTFVVSAVFSLVLYNRSKSVKNEEEFM